MEVEMWLGGITGVADEAENVAGADFVTDFHAQGPRLHVGIERETAAADVHNDVIAAEGFEGHGNGAGVGARSVLRNAVLDFGDNTIGDGMNFRAVRAVVLVVAGV